MPSRPDLWPARMCRVGIVAPSTRARRVLVEIAGIGTLEPDGPADERDTDRAGRPAGGAGAVVPVLSRDPPGTDPAVDEEDPRLLAGEASLTRRLECATERGRCTILPGWMRAADVDDARAAIEPYGGAVVELPRRPGLLPPTAYTRHRASAAFRPLVATYGTVPYADVDPTLFAAGAYVFMFGMMFGDVAHGAAIALLGVGALVARSGRLAGLRPLAWFLVSAGASAVVFGFLYGDCFGPTGLVPTLWIQPLDEPAQFLVAGLLVGVVLLAGTFVLSIVDRWREGGAALAIYEPSGVAGGALLIAVAAAGIALATSSDVAWWTAAAFAALGTMLLFVGFVVRSGAGAAGIAQAFMELFDTVLRLGSNVISFTRLAAFGLTHAVITDVVWQGTTALWDRAGLFAVAAVALFVGGNVLAIALGALVAAIQALRLEYYELFSRLFTTSGRPFTPWHVDILPREAS